MCNNIIIVVFSKLQQLMIANEYSDIAADYDDVRPLDEVRMRTLAINGVQLMDRIVANVVFVTELATVGCITWPQREHLVNITQPRDRNNKLLEFLTRRSVADFQKFINVLSKKQAHLVPLLVTDGGETHYVNVKKNRINWYKVFKSGVILLLVVLMVYINGILSFRLTNECSYKAVVYCFQWLLV